MTSTTIPISKITVILDSPRDWDEWLFLVKSRARENDILPYIDIDSTHDPSILLEPSDPESKDVNNTATSVINLNRDEREIYGLLRDEYRVKQAKYEKKRAALNNLRRFITEIITRMNLAFIIDLEIVYEIIHALKKRLAPTDRAR